VGISDSEFYLRLINTRTTETNDLLREILDEIKGKKEVKEINPSVIDKTVELIRRLGYRNTK